MARQGRIILMERGCSMNVRHIEYVRTILREGGFTAAAKRLYLSQPALSQSIKQLETELGAQVFDRQSDPISLTYAGRRYLEAAQRIQEIEQGLRADLAENAGAIHARLRLGISRQRGLNLLPLVIPEYAQRYPHVKLELVEQGSDALERLTAEGECDFALVTTNRKLSRLRYVLIESEEVVLLAGKDTGIAQCFADGTAISIAEAAEERFVSMVGGHSVRLIQARLFDRYRLSPNILMETGNMEAGKNVAALAGAVMLIPRVYVPDEWKARVEAKCFPVLDNDYERHFCFCCRRGMRLPQYMEDFVRITCGKLGVPFAMPGEADPPDLRVRPTGE